MAMKELTASEITNEALRLLRTYGYAVWRQNNLATRGRKNIVTPGVSDIIGWTGSGIFVACEVKKIGDTIKKDQAVFLTSLLLSGGYAYVATQIGSNVVIKNYEAIQQKKNETKY